MTTQSNLLATSQRAALETAQDVSFQMLDAAGKLLELNLRTSRTLIADATQKLASTLQANGGQATDQQAAAALAPSSQQASDYAKQVYEIATQANAGIVAVLQKHAMTFGPQAAMQSMTAAAQGATEGGANPFVAALTNPFGAAQKAFKQAVETTSASAAAVSAQQPQSTAA